MSNPKSSSTQGSQLALIDQIELLVENELSASQRSQLLLRLDTQPEQWRVLALAFVEHQVLRNSIQQVCNSAEPIEPTLKPANAESSLPRSTISQFNWLTIAASLLLVFAGGIVIGNWNQTSRFASQAMTSEPATDTTTLTSEGGDGLKPSSAQFSANVVGYVEWTGSFGKQLSPVFSGNEIDEEWLARNPPQINEKIERRLARAGWRASPERRFVSLKLTEGKQFTIPMDDISYRYVGRELL